MPKPKIQIYSNPPETIQPEPTFVDIWLIDIGAGQDWSEPNVLSPDEYGKAVRIVIPEKRLQYISACVFLRRILAQYVENNPGNLEFVYTPAGKPSLSGEHSGKLFFNISHSFGKMLVGITSTGEIGIDIEKINKRRLINKIAERRFAERERYLLESCREDESSRFFCTLWTRKEAVLKAAGTGLLFPIRNIDVSDADNGQPAFIPPLPSKYHWIDKTEWHFYDIDTFEGFCAAVAVADPPETIRILRPAMDYIQP